MKLHDSKLIKPRRGQLNQRFSSTAFSGALRGNKSESSNSIEFQMAQVITVIILLVCFIFQLVLYSNLEYSQIETKKVFQSQVDIVRKIQDNLDHFEIIQHQINDNRNEFYLYVTDLYANIERLKKITNQ